MSTLAKKTVCLATGEVPPLKGKALAKLGRQLKGRWQVVKGHHLEKEYAFKNFLEALAFTTASANWPRLRAITRTSTSPGARSS